jgi:hypothetical protein
MIVEDRPATREQMMTNRRQFLQIGITAGAWPLAAGAARAAGTRSAQGGNVPLYKVIYDRRFEDSVAFARRMETLDVPLHAIEGDMTRFWFDELYYAWRRGPAAIAGLTAHGPLFCFERLAWDQGLRVVFRAEHKPVGGSLEHDLSGPLTMLHESLALTNAGTRWSECMADVVAHCPRGRAEIATTRLKAEATTAVAASDGEPLYSWVIAPATRG